MEGAYVLTPSTMLLLAVAERWPRGARRRWLRLANGNWLVRCANSSLQFNVHICKLEHWFFM